MFLYQRIVVHSVLSTTDVVVIFDTTLQVLTTLQAVSSSTRYTFIESIILCLFKVVITLFVGAVRCFCQLSLCPFIVEQVEPCKFILRSQLFDIRMAHYSFATRVQAYDWKFVSIDSGQDKVTGAGLVVCGFTAFISELLLTLCEETIIADVT